MRITQPVDLHATMHSGQTFAFLPHQEGFIGAVDGRALFVRQEGDGLLLDCPIKDEPFWHAYFDLDREYEALLAPFEGDPVFAACYRAYPSLRLLRQPVWETICAFILSANNHQSRIHRLYQLISAAWGEARTIAGATAYAFPSPAMLASADEAALRALGVGYRAPYLLKTARMIAGGFSLDLDALPYLDAHAHLLRLPGVGPKVADCILLFSTRHGCAFPLDVWMLRVMRVAYGMEGSPAAVKRQAMERFGDLGGLAQQMLFHGARTGVIDVSEKAEA